eukprot:11197793-Lingulodinium_polyedra.AAC.1
MAMVLRRRHPDRCMQHPSLRHRNTIAIECPGARRPVVFGQKRPVAFKQIRPAVERIASAPSVWFPKYDFNSLG